jgi:hypothetical protein
MASNDMTDPGVVEADQRVERAKASLRARMSVLERRLGDVRDQVDVPEHIRRHPWPAVGIAFALGALAGNRGRPNVPSVAPERSLGGMVTAGVLAVGLRLVREFALAQIGRAARRWWLQNGGDPEVFGATRHDPFGPP